MAVPEAVRPYLALVLERLGWRPTLWGRFGPMRFERDVAASIWLTPDMLAWVTDPVIRQWLLTFFGIKGWAEAGEWPPKFE